MTKTATPSPQASPTGKGKEKEKEKRKEPDPDAFLEYGDMLKIAKEFVRSGSVVRKCFRKWKRRVTDRAIYAEAFARSEQYTERLQRERMSSSVSSVASRASEGSVKRQRRMSDAPESVSAKRRSPRKSMEFQPRRTDEALSRTLKEVCSVFLSVICLR